MVSPTLDTAKGLQNYDLIPIKKELLSDFITPIEVLRRLQNVSRHCYILESVENQEKWGRYTFLGYDPKLEISCMGGEMTVKDVRTGDTKVMTTERPADYFRELWQRGVRRDLRAFPALRAGLSGISATITSSTASLR